jgi:hypothetical protein
MFSVCQPASFGNYAMCIGGNGMDPMLKAYKGSETNLARAESVGLFGTGIRTGI